MDVVDDSEDDSDYAPENNADSDSEPETEIRIEEISVSRKRRMEELFSDMHNEEVKVTRARVDSSLMHATKKMKSKESASGSRKKKKPKSFNAIASIFGKKAARKILHMDTSSAASVSVPTTEPETETEDPVGGSASKNEELRQKAREVAQSALKKSVVVDTMKFAGQEIA